MVVHDKIKQVGEENMKKILKKVKNVLKVLFLFIANFILSFFSESKKTSSQEKKEEKRMENKLPEQKKKLKTEEEDSDATFSTRNFGKEYQKKTIEEEMEELLFETLEKLREPKEIVENLKEEKKEMLKDIKKKFEKEKIPKQEYKKEINKYVEEKVEEKKVIQKLEERKEEESLENKSPKGKEEFQNFPDAPKVVSVEEVIPKMSIKPEEKTLPLYVAPFMGKEDHYEVKPKMKVPDSIETEQEKIEEIPVVSLKESEIEKEEMGLSIWKLFSENIEDYEEKEIALDNKLEELSTELLKPLTPEEKQVIEKEIEYTKKEQEETKKKKEHHIKQEEKDLEEPIHFEEKEQLKKELKKQYYEEQLELQEKLLKDLDKKTEAETKEIEKKIIKERIRKSSHLLEVPCFLGLPFIKNKYFYAFTMGLFISNHFSFVKRLLFHETKEYQEIDLSYLKQGSDALEHAILKNKQNVIALQQLEQDIYLKYPELKEDEEFLKYMEDLKIDLYLNEQKLRNKQKKTVKYLHRGPKRVLKRQGIGGYI